MRMIALIKACSVFICSTLRIPALFMEEFRKQKPGLAPGFVHTLKSLTHSIRDSPASVQSSDRARASSGRVLLNQCCYRGTKSPRGIFVRFRASNRPARQTTDSHRPPASASRDRRNTPPRSLRRRCGRNSCCDSAAVRRVDPAPLFQRGGFKGFHVFNGLLNAVPVHIQQRGTQ